MFELKSLVHVDNLSLIMIALVSFVAVCVASFSTRYLRGDRKKGAFYGYLVVMVIAVCLMVSADHIVLLLCTWCVSNACLVRLMLHKKAWRAAQQSSFLALRNFVYGFAFLSAALYILYSVSGQTSIQAIANTPISALWLLVSSILMVLAAMTQSALWPFHSWLTSSLNSPTPVSAIMHAGLVNGGGFLLTRFAPLMGKQPALLNVIFVTGLVTAILGTLWKLMQTDIKRMLACSTMGQMGFMVAQCGLGLFPAAVAHLCWHGLCKAFLFLASGAAAQEKRLDMQYPPSLKDFFLALLCGGCAAILFALTSQKVLFAPDTSALLVAITAMAGTQFALPLIRGGSVLMYPLIGVLTSVMGALYGVSVYAIEWALMPLNLSHPQPLNGWHSTGLLVLVLAWLSVLFSRRSKHALASEAAQKAYVRMLNASQPHPKTISSHRNHYQY